MKPQGKKILDFYSELKVPSKTLKGVEVLHPFESEEVQRVNQLFYERFYNDTKSRYFLIGINPGRLGAGVTGLPFTDPVFLEERLTIKNNFQKKHELSSIFVYDIIQAYGGPEAFYSDFYFTSVSPLGFTRDGRNLNYYDDKVLQENLKEYIVSNLKEQVHLVKGHRKIAFCLGMGKNYAYLSKLNQEHAFFDEIKALPHPRWVMQYRLKRKQEFIDAYLDAFRSIH